MRSKIRIALICLMAVLLSNCAINGPGDSFCAIARPVYVASSDELSDGTARQIYDYDETGRKLCNWDWHKSP